MNSFEDRQIDRERGFVCIMLMLLKVLISHDCKSKLELSWAFYHKIRTLNVVYM